MSFICNCGWFRLMVYYFILSYKKFTPHQLNYENIMTISYIANRNTITTNKYIFLKMEMIYTTHRCKRNKIK